MASTTSTTPTRISIYEMCKLLESANTPEPPTASPSIHINSPSNSTFIKTTSKSQQIKERKRKIIDINQSQEYDSSPSSKKRRFSGFINKNEELQTKLERAIKENKKLNVELDNYQEDFERMENENDELKEENELLNERLVKEIDDKITNEEKSKTERNNNYWIK